MQRLVNPVTVRAFELKPGDVMAVTVTCHIMRGANNELVYRLYRCGYPPQEHEGIPQGSRLAHSEKEVVQGLFPVVAWAELEPDLF